MNEAALALKLLLKLAEAYANARELAEKAGVAKEDLAAADARFAKVYQDPLAGGSGTVVDFPDPYSGDLDAYPNRKLLKPGDIIWQKPDGKFRVQPVGVGIHIPPDWRQVEVIGE